MKINFQNKTAVITGGASGIGRALCIALAARGCRIISADINDEGNRKTASLIENGGGTCRAASLDVTDSTAVERLAHDTAAETGSLDFFINCAAVSVMGYALDLEEHHWKRIMDINYEGVRSGTMAAYRIMARQGHGSIINISSMAGFAPFSLNAPYTAAKYAVAGLTEAIRHEAAARGVTMHLVYPGIVDTPFYQSMVTPGHEKNHITEKLPSFRIIPAKAAALIIRGMRKNKKVIIFPLHARLLYYAVKYTPWIIPIINRKLLREFDRLPRPPQSP